MAVTFEAVMAVRKHYVNLSSKDRKTMVKDAMDCSPDDTKVHLQMPLYGMQLCADGHDCCLKKLLHVRTKMQSVRTDDGFVPYMCERERCMLVYS